MGDIFLGGLLVIFILIAGLISMKSKQRNTEKLIRNIIGVGAVLGLVVSFTQHGAERAIGLLLFYFQLVGIILISINKKRSGYLILCLTLLLQIPIFQFDHFRYRSQTLFGLNLQEFPGKYFDVEPGSYVSYFDATYGSQGLFPIGTNLLSISLFVYFNQRRSVWKGRTTANSSFKK